MRSTTLALVARLRRRSAVRCRSAPLRHPRARHLAGSAFICGVQNAEDLVLVPNTRWMVASGMAPGSGLHIVDTQAKTVRNLYAVGAANARADKTKYANCPGPLDAKQAVLHGLSLRPARERTLHRLRHEPWRPRVGGSLRARHQRRRAHGHLGRMCR